MRKVWQKAPGLVEERWCLSGNELFRRQGADVLEREALHVMLGDLRVALVEMRTQDTAGTDQAPATLVRYQHGDHVGTVALELDDRAEIISYEEYSPFSEVRPTRRCAA